MRGIIATTCSVFFLISLSGCIVSKKEYLLKSDEADKSAARLEDQIIENRELKSELSSNQNDLQASKHRIEELLAQMHTLSEESEAFQSNLATQEAIGNELREQNTRLNGLLQSKEISQSQIIKETMEINKKLRENNTELREQLAGRSGEMANISRELDLVRADKKRREQEIEQLKGTYDELVKNLQGEIEAGEIQVRRMKDRLSVNLVDKILFDSGRTEIKDSGLAVLRKVGRELQKIEGKRIQIEGHTDNVPIGDRLREKYPTNWELSGSRSLAVVHFLQNDVGINPGLLSAGCYGEYQPVESNETPAGQALNRRIEIVLLPPYAITTEAQETTQ